MPPKSLPSLQHGEFVDGSPLNYGKTVAPALLLKQSSTNRAILVKARPSTIDDRTPPEITGFRVGQSVATLEYYVSSGEVAATSFTPRLTVTLVLSSSADIDDRVAEFLSSASDAYVGRYEELEYDAAVPIAVPSLSLTATHYFDAAGSAWVPLNRRVPVYAHLIASGNRDLYTAACVGPYIPVPVDVPRHAVAYSRFVVLYPQAPLDRYTAEGVMVSSFVKHNDVYVYRQASRGAPSSVVAIDHPHIAHTIPVEDLDVGSLLVSSRPTFALNMAGNTVPCLNAHGTLFYFDIQRNCPPELRVYAIYQDTVVTVEFEASNAGVFQDESWTLNVAMDTVEISTLSNTKGYYRITSDHPIVGMKAGNKADYVHLMPASTAVVAFTYGHWSSVMPGDATVTTHTNGNAQIITSDVPIVAQFTADNHGYHTMQALPADLCGNDYIIPHRVNGYQLASMEPVTVSVYNIDDNGLPVFDKNINLSGSATSPGFYAEGSHSSGGQSIAWNGIQFMGTAKFVLRTNSPTSNEYNVLGYRMVISGPVLTQSSTEYKHLLDGGTVLLENANAVVLKFFLTSSRLDENSSLTLLSGSYPEIVTHVLPSPASPVELSSLSIEATRYWNGAEFADMDGDSVVFGYLLLLDSATLAVLDYAIMGPYVTVPLTIDKHDWANHDKVVMLGESADDDITTDGIIVAGFQPNTVIRIHSPHDRTITTSVTLLNNNLGQTLTYAECPTGSILRSDKPFFAYNNSGHPLPSYTLASTVFYFESRRFNRPFVHLYSMYTKATVTVYFKTTNDTEPDVDPEETWTEPVPKDFVTTVQLSRSSGYYKVVSDRAIVATKSGNEGDYFLLHPTGTTMIGFDYGTYSGVIPGSVSVTSHDVGNAVVKHHASDAFTFQYTADSKGHHAVLAVSSEHLGDTYIIPHPVEGVQIAAIEDTTVLMYEILADGNVSLRRVLDMTASTLSDPEIFEIGNYATGGSRVAAVGVRLEGTAPFALRSNNLSHNESIYFGYRKQS